MPPKPLIRTNECPYHITARSNNKEFFQISVESLWEIFMDCMGQAQSKYGCHFHAFVLMSNHYHLLVSTPLNNIDDVMQYIQREVARKANKKSTRINHFFGGAYKWSLVYEENYYWNVLKYIFRNPIRAGICSTVECYKFSSLNLKPSNFNWIMNDFFHNKNKPILLDLEWLNEPYLNEIERNIQLGLRRKLFKLPCDQTGRRPALDSPHTKK